MEKSPLALTLLAACATSTDSVKSAPQTDPMHMLTAAEGRREALQEALGHLLVEQTGDQTDNSLVSCVSGVAGATRALLAAAGQDAFYTEDGHRAWLARELRMPIHPANTYTSNLISETRRRLADGSTTVATGNGGPYTFCLRVKPGDELGFVLNDLRKVRPNNSGPR